MRKKESEALKNKTSWIVETERCPLCQAYIATNGTNVWCIGDCEFFCKKEEHERYKQQMHADNTAK